MIVLRRKSSLIAAFAIALGVHYLFANTLVFTFPHAIVPPKPMFVFLGSFLRADDFLISARVDSEQGQALQNQRFNLDIRSGSLPREMGKPDLTIRISPVIKYQYRPEMSKDKVHLKLDKADDLGIDLAPFPVIKMRIDQRDQD